MAHGSEHIALGTVHLPSSWLLWLLTRDAFFGSMKPLHWAHRALTLTEHPRGGDIVRDSDDTGVFPQRLGGLGLLDRSQLQLCKAGMGVSVILRGRDRQELLERPPTALSP